MISMKEGEAINDYDLWVEKASGASKATDKVISNRLLAAAPKRLARKLQYKTFST